MLIMTQMKVDPMNTPIRMHRNSKYTIKCRLTLKKIISSNYQYPLQVKAKAFAPAHFPESPACSKTLDKRLTTAPSVVWR